MWESMIATFGNCNSTFDFCYSHMDFVRLFLYYSPCWHYEYVLHCFCIIFGLFVVILYNIDFSMKLCMFFGMHQRLWCFTFPHTILDLRASAQSDGRPLFQSSLQTISQRQVKVQKAPERKVVKYTVNAENSSANHDTVTISFKQVRSQFLIAKKRIAFFAHCKDTRKSTYLCLSQPSAQSKWTLKMKKLKLFITLMFLFTACTCTFWIQKVEGWDMLEGKH